MKNVFCKVKLQIAAMKATSAPPIGAILGQKKINIGNFCKQFNDKTKCWDPDVLYPVIITIFIDKSFSFMIKTPSVSNLIKKYCNIKKGSVTSGRTVVGYINTKIINKIAELKSIEIIFSNLEGVKKMIVGTTKSMGVKII